MPRPTPHPHAPSRSRSRSKRGLSLALLLGTALFASGLWPRAARAFIHIVQPGDSLASLAEGFYGRIQHERLLVAANLLDAEGGIRIVPGMRLEIPASTYVRVVPGDTWKSLAATLLGGEHRAHALALANDSKAWLPPPVDAEVLIPYNLRVVATGNETIPGLAYRFLADRKQAWMLDQYNQREGRALVRGEVVLIPITDLTLTERGREAAAQAQVLARGQAEGQIRETQRQVARELELLERDVRHGDYVRAVQRGAGFLALGPLTRPQRARVQRLLLEAYVALDAIGLAKESCAAWRQDDPKAALDPVRLSPKILAACEGASK